MAFASLTASTYISMAATLRDSTETQLSGESNTVVERPIGQVVSSSTQDRETAVTVMTAGGPRAIDGVESFQPGENLPSAAMAFLDHLLRLNLVSPSMAGPFLHANAGRLSRFDGALAIGEALVKAKLLTSYQL